MKTAAFPAHAHRQHSPADEPERRAQQATGILAAVREHAPAAREQIGDLTLVPVERRVSGPTSSLAMAAFIHVSRERPGRFSDGGYRVWYCGDRFEVALAETAHHFERYARPLP